MNATNTAASGSYDRTYKETLKLKSSIIVGLFGLVLCAFMMVTMWLDMKEDRAAVVSSLEAVKVQNTAMMKQINDLTVSKKYAYRGVR